MTPAAKSQFRAGLASCALGFGLWALSPLIAGTREPWDAEWPFYPIAFLVGGAAIGWWVPGRPVVAFLGIWLGQALAFIVLPGRDLGWLPLSVVTTAIGGAVGSAGYLSAWFLFSLWRMR